MPTNEIKQFAGAADANVLTQAQYAALTTILSDGFQPGVLPSRYLNKVLRQVAFMSAGLAKFLENAGEDVLDDGDLDALVTSIGAAFSGMAASTADDLAGGVANQIPWQSGVGATSFLGPTNSAILTTNGSGVPSLTAASAVTVGTASAVPITGITGGTPARIAPSLDQVGAFAIAFSASSYYAGDTLPSSGVGVWGVNSSGGMTYPGGTWKSLGYMTSGGLAPTYNYPVMIIRTA